MDLVSYETLRQQVLRRDSWRCQACSATSNLEVHHKVRNSAAILAPVRKRTWSPSAPRATRPDITENATDQGCPSADYSSNFNNSLTSARVAQCDNSALTFQLKLRHASERGQYIPAGRFFALPGMFDKRGVLFMSRSFLLFLLVTLAIALISCSGGSSVPAQPIPGVSGWWEFIAASSTNPGYSTGIEVALKEGQVFVNGNYSENGQISASAQQINFIGFTPSGSIVFGGNCARQRKIREQSRWQRFRRWRVHELHLHGKRQHIQCDSDS